MWTLPSMPVVCLYPHFRVLLMYNLDDLGDNYSEKDADNTDNAPTYVRWDRHLLCGGEIS